MRVIASLAKPLLCGIVLCACGVWASTPGVDAKVAVKAAVIHKISKFVGWPESAFDSKTSPIMFCVAGDSRMYEALSDLNGRSVHGRKVVVRYIAGPAETARDCQVLYLAIDDVNRVRLWMQEIVDLPVLTFADAESHGGEHSIVTMSIRRNKVRFAINLEANENTGLSISAQLLQLAVTLSRGGA